MEDDDDLEIMNDDDETQNDSDEDDDRPAKKVKKKGKKEEEEETPHCDINFVKNTPYSLLAGSTTKVWGTAKAEDPAPKVPDSRKDTYKTGDYLLVKGNSINLKHTGNLNTKVTFDPEEELILTSGWDRFDDQMTGQDLFDLDDNTFLLWWQNVKPPAIPKPKAPTVAAKKKTKKAGGR
jgi:hypothetical protein